MENLNNRMINVFLYYVQARICLFLYTKTHTFPSFSFVFGQQFNIKNVRKLNIVTRIRRE